LDGICIIINKADTEKFLNMQPKDQKRIADRSGRLGTTAAIGLIFLAGLSACGETIRAEQWGVLEAASCTAKVLRGSVLRWMKVQERDECND
jgi:hypothetical protein